MAKLLQIAGVLALLAWTGLGVAAWMLVKDRLQITFTDGAATARDANDPVATLQGQVENLQKDVSALSQGIGRSLENLAALQGEEADARSKELARTLGASIRELRSTLNARQLQLAAATGDGPAVIDPPNVVAPQSAPDPTASEAPAIASTTPSAPPKRKSFLAISLPSEDFAFDDTRSWKIIPNLSRVGFDAKSTLHDFTGVTSKLSGDLRTNLASTGAGTTGSITVDATGLRTGLDGRDEAMAEHLGTNAHPQMTFAATSMSTTSVDSKARTVQGTVEGTMTIHGVEKAVSMPVTLTVDKSLRLGIEGQMPLTMSAYGVEPPNQLGVVKVEDDVQVWINLKARLVPRATDDKGTGR